MIGWTANVYKKGGGGGGSCTPGARGQEDHLLYPRAPRVPCCTPGGLEDHPAVPQGDKKITLLYLRGTRGSPCCTPGGLEDHPWSQEDHPAVPQGAKGITLLYPQEAKRISLGAKRITLLYPRGPRGSPLEPRGSACCTPGGQEDHPCRTPGGQRDHPAVPQGAKRITERSTLELSSPQFSLLSFWAKAACGITVFCHSTSSMIRSPGYIIDCSRMIWGRGKGLHLPSRE